MTNDKKKKKNYRLTLILLLISLPIIAFIESKLFYGTSVRDFWYYIWVSGIEFAMFWVGYTW